MHKVNESVDIPDSDSRMNLQEDNNRSLKTLTPREIEMEEFKDKTRLTEMNDIEDQVSDSYFEKELEDHMKEMLNVIQIQERISPKSKLSGDSQKKEPVQIGADVLAEPALPSDPIAALIQSQTSSYFHLSAFIVSMMFV